jgi:hypothetical protein
MPDAAREFDQMLDYLNERTCHRCATRYGDDNHFAEHLRTHREGEKLGMIADLLEIHDQTGHTEGEPCVEH